MRGSKPARPVTHFFDSRFPRRKMGSMVDVGSLFPFRSCLHSTHAPKAPNLPCGSGSVCLEWPSGILLDHRRRDGQIWLCMRGASQVDRWRLCTPGRLVTSTKEERQKIHSVDILTFRSRFPYQSGSIAAPCTRLGRSGTRIGARPQAHATFKL